MRIITRDKVISYLHRRVSDAIACKFIEQCKEERVCDSVSEYLEKHGPRGLIWSHVIQVVKNEEARDAAMIPGVLHSNLN